MGISASKRVSRSFQDSQDFNSACDSVFEESLNLTEHAFPVIFPYQLADAAGRLHHSLSLSNPLIKNWSPLPPSRVQVDRAYRATTKRSPTVSNDDEVGKRMLGRDEFREFAVEVFTDAVVSNARKAVVTRVPIGVAGIAGIGMVTRSRKDWIGTAVVAYALGVATNIYIGLSA